MFNRQTWLILAAAVVVSIIGGLWQHARQAKALTPTAATAPDSRAQ